MDLPKVISQVATFLEKPLTSDQVSKLADHLSFENMKTNPMVNVEMKPSWWLHLSRGQRIPFMRKGVVGSFKETMSLEMVQEFDEWTKTKGIASIWNQEDL